MTTDPLALTRSIPSPIRQAKKEPTREDVLDQINRCREHIVDEKATLAKMDEREKELRRRMAGIQLKAVAVRTHLDFHQKKERRLEAILAGMK